MSSFVILLGGSLTMTDRLRRQCAGARLIAADSGMHHAALFDRGAELWVGDFDSTDDELGALYRDVPRERHDPDKAKTDGELAVDAALARGATSLVLAGALGGERTDHAVYHATLTMSLAERGIDVIASSGEEELWPLVPGTRRFDFPAGTRFSVIGFSDIAGLTLDGVRWPLDEAAIPFGSSRTLSNIVTGTLSVNMTLGKAFILAHPAAAQ